MESLSPQNMGGTDTYAIKLLSFDSIQLSFGRSDAFALCCKGYCQPLYQEMRRRPHP